jgi:hypothetical protein
MQSKMVYAALAYIYWKFILLRNHAHTCFHHSDISPVRFSINRIHANWEFQKRKFWKREFWKRKNTKTRLRRNLHKLYWRVHAPSINRIDVIYTPSGNDIMLLLLILCEKQRKTCMVLVPMHKSLFNLQWFWVIEK